MEVHSDARGAIRDTLAHRRLLPLGARYCAQSAEKGQACIIDVTPERVEVLTSNQ